MTTKIITILLIVIIVTSLLNAFIYNYLHFNNSITTKDICLLTPRVTSILEERDDYYFKTRVEFCNKTIEKYSIENPCSLIIKDIYIKENTLLLEMESTLSKSFECIISIKTAFKNNEYIIPIVLNINEEENPRFKTDAILLKFVNTTYVRIWEWSIRYPHKLDSRTFIVPELRQFKLLEDYLELELYVNMLIPRNNVWWPYQRNYGPYIINKTLEEVLRIRDYEDFKTISVLLWPNFTKGITIGYEGYVSPICMNSLCIYKFIIGGLDKPILYIQTPMNIKVLSIVIDGKLMNCSEHIYIENLYEWCAIKLNYSFCGPSELILLTKYS